MKINGLVMWVLIDPIMAGSYNRNETLLGFVLLLKCGAHRLAFEFRHEIRWGSHLSWNVELV